MVQIKLKLKKKTKEEDKKKEVSIYKSTFNAINNIIFVTIICFDWRKWLLYSLLQSFENVISGLKFYDKQNYEKFEHIW